MAADETPSPGELSRRTSLARSILGHAPDITPVRRALMALEGAPEHEIRQAQGSKATAVDGHELAVWMDGYDQGREQRCIQCQAVFGAKDVTAA